MNEQQISKILDKIQSWMNMTCAGCAMPEKLNPLIEEIRKLLIISDKSADGEKQ